VRGAGLAALSLARLSSETTLSLPPTPYPTFTPPHPQQPSVPVRRGPTTPCALIPLGKFRALRQQWTPGHWWPNPAPSYPPFLPPLPSPPPPLPFRPFLPSLPFLPLPLSLLPLPSPPSSSPPRAIPCAPLCSTLAESTLLPPSESETTETAPLPAKGRRAPHKRAESAGERPPFPLN